MRFYFDHNSGTTADPRVVDRFLEVECTCPGNPGALHQSGRRSRKAVEEARDLVAQALGVPSKRVFFVSGGTEANNIAVLGGGDPHLPVLHAAVEHPSVFEAAKRRGSVLWPVDEQGRARIDPPEGIVGLVCLVHAQNEIGTLQPIAEAGQLARALELPLHVDAAQTLGRCELEDVLEFANSVSFSGHKAGGLRGMSVLVANPEDFSPLFYGGGQQHGLRPGTESPSLAAATALALKLAIDEQASRALRMQAARSAFEACLPGHAMRVTPADSLPNTCMYQFLGIDGRELLPALDMAGVEASLGSSCSSGSPEPPAVLRAMGFDKESARSCVRFSFSHETSVGEATEGGTVVAEVADRLLRL